MSTQKPEPDNLANLIRSGLKWGPVNSQVAVNAKFRCEYCGLDMLKDLESYYSWQIDQIMPGSGYNVDGCALACRTCNHLKHNDKPTGNNRSERIEAAKQIINIKKSRRIEELQKLREILGYSPIDDKTNNSYVSVIDSKKS